MYKAPGSATGKTGGVGSVCNIFDRNEKSEPVPDWEVVRIFHVWWNWLDSNQHHAAFQGRTQPLSYSSI